jgi:dTDP-glucose 4,6-dehydratase
MRLLITGGCGFLGAHLVEHFLKNTDFEIVVLDKLTYASNGYDRLRDVRVTRFVGQDSTVDGVASGGHGELLGAHEHPRVRILGCDLAQPIPEGIRRELGEVDYIIHAAAESHVDNSIIDPLPFLQSNVIGTHHLLWFARELEHLRRIFCVSTDEVYGPASWDHPGNVPTDPFRPANPYSGSKAGGECVAMAYANTYKLPVTIVSTMNLIGERQHFEKYVPLVIRKVLSGEKLPIHADPTKTRSGTRFYIHCRNFASALQFLIDRSSLINDGVTNNANAFAMPLKIHVSGEREISNLDLAQMIASFVGKPLNYELVDFHSSRPGHDLRYALDAREIRAMGWKQPLDIEASLEKTVRWFLDSPRWLGLPA